MMTTTSAMMTMLDNFTNIDDNTSSATTTAEDAWLHGTLANIRGCFLPIIVAGTITNCLNFIVLSHKEMRGFSTSVYLFALAVADLGVMYLELFRVWFEWTMIVDPANYFTDNYCRIANYTNGVARDYSNWLIACLTLERLVMVASPYRAKYLCTTEKAKRVVIGLLLIICVPHIHCLIFSTAQFHIWWVCWEDPKSVVGKNISAAVEFIVGYVVIIVVFVLNLILSFLIYKNHIPASAPSSSSNLTSYKRNSHNKRLTRTLLVVAVVFIVCETPRMMLSFMFKLIEKTPRRRIIYNAAFLLSGINHAVNFFIYIVSSPRFRHLLLESLSRNRFSNCFRRCPSRTADSREASVQVNLQLFVGVDQDRDTEY